VELDINNSDEVTPQLSHKSRPVDGVWVGGCWFSTLGPGTQTAMADKKHFCSLLLLIIIFKIKK
jgi:hypothetical protein